MNTAEFLQQVESCIADISYVELKEVFYQFVRKIPVEERQAFLQLLPSVQSGAEEVGSKEPLTEFETIVQSLLQIKSGLLSMNSQLNEQFDDWHDDWDEMFFFSDYEEIVARITSAVQWLRFAIETKNWQEGNQVAQLLLELEISVDGEYSDYDYDEMTLYRLVSNNICKISYPSFLADALYLTCRSYDLSERSRILYKHLSQPYVCVGLEQVVNRGEPLEDRSVFLSFWIDFLLEQDYFPAKHRLLSGAYSMLETDEEKFAIATKYITSHPFLLGEYFKHSKKEISIDDYLQRGRESLERMPVNEPVRSKIALYLSDVVGNQLEREELLVEVFRSNRTIVNFLRLLPVLSTNKERLGELVGEQSESVSYGYRNHLQDVGAVKQAIFRLLLGESIGSTKQLASEPSILSPLLTFGCLFLLQSSSPSLLMNRLLSQLESYFEFSQQNFLREGASSVPKEVDTSLLWDVLSEWKTYLEQSEIVQKQVVEEMGVLLDSYVDDILSNQKRHAYSNCASLIAGLGEVKESMGESNAKEDLLQVYHKKYPRHTSFRKDLRKV